MSIHPMYDSNNEPATTKTIGNALLPYIEQMVDADFLMKEIEEEELKEQTNKFLGKLSNRGLTDPDDWGGITGGSGRPQ